MGRRNQFGRGAAQGGSGTPPFQKGTGQILKIDFVVARHEAGKRTKWVSQHGVVLSRIKSKFQSQNNPSQRIGLERSFVAHGQECAAHFRCANQTRHFIERLRMRCFSQLPYYDVTEAFDRAATERKLVHSVILWGALDDQSC